jgi:hypothetical protein
MEQIKVEQSKIITGEVGGNKIVNENIITSLQRNEKN